ncbi:hypothetical protein RclHR1_00410024 [Rhizophagus clarus]|uniref:Rieske domain-containing protein n=1 Tax=Rhizophagus clarus TaxID=94130 RepID=A0A2Z6S9E7_9GLOM|nr:hypothetical protein RclHR1_00410024 [Rhizophagus clarus]
MNGRKNHLFCTVTNRVRFKSTNLAYKSSRENVTKNTNMNEPKKTNRLIMENRLRIRTSDGKAYEVDRWCPHANSDLASRGVILGSKLICTKHSWAFSLDQGGKCTSADATINACSINDW